MKPIKIILLTLFVGISSLSYGMRPKRTNAFSSYKDKVHEFGYGVNLSYLKYQKSFNPQLHIHYSRYLTNYFSVGVGYGGIYDEYFHNTINLEVSIRFYEKLVVAFKPGWTFKKYNGKTNSLYSMAISGAYEFQVSENIHLGPMVEIAMLQDDTNYLAGCHMGFTF